MMVNKSARAHCQLTSFIILLLCLLLLHPLIFFYLSPILTIILGSKLMHPRCHYPTPRNKCQISRELVGIFMFCLEPSFLTCICAFSLTAVSCLLDLVLLLLGVVLDMLPETAVVSVSLLTSKHLTPVWLLLIYRCWLFIN